MKPAEYVRAHLDNEHDPDGEFLIYMHKEEKSEWLDTIGLFHEVSMARPLIQIKSAEDLSVKVIGPLLAEIDKAVTMN